MERSVYRIIDANFNRAREALRLIEEYCRFGIDSKLFSEKAKKLRHELCAVVGGMDTGALMAGRDSEGDVGLGIKVEGQLERTDLRDCFTAGCKRLSEALRSLAEMASIEDVDMANRIERLRFAAYTLEKDVALFAEPAEKYAKVRLYVVITSNDRQQILSLAEKCAAGGADCIQMRSKGADDCDIFETAVEFVKVCSAGGALSIINDRADIAVLSGADGVHVGQEDLPVAQIRSLQKKPMILGKSTHSPGQLQTAIADNVTYAALGPVFPTGTKPKVKPVTLDYVRRGSEALRETGIGNVAIGGITVDNVEQVLKAGAGSIAVCAAATQAEDPAEACRKLKEKIVSFFSE